MLSQESCVSFPNPALGIVWSRPAVSEEKESDTLVNGV